MSKTQSDFTPEQKHAIETSDRRLAASTVVERAAAGELAPELEPFNVSVSTVRELRRKIDTEKRLNGQARDQALDKLDRDIVAAMDRALAEINREAKETGRTDLTRLRQLAGARKNMREANTAAGKSRPEQDEDTTTTPGLMSRLAQQGAQSKAPRSNGHATGEQAEHV